MRKKKTKYIHSGDYVAEVEVNLITTEDEWSPYLSLKDAKKLDMIREALQSDDFVRLKFNNKIKSVIAVDVR